MPLKPNRTPAEDDRFEVRFEMRDGDATVECFVDEAALDDMEGAEGEPALARFARHRAFFESIASWLYDEGEETPRVELHHLALFNAR